MRRDDLRHALAALIAAISLAALVALVAGASGAADVLRERGATAAAFAAFAIVLQFLALRVPGRGCISVSAIGVLAAGFELGAGVAMLVGLVVALGQWARARGFAHRALFDAANLVLAGGGAAVLYDALASGPGLATPIAAALLAGVAYAGLNHLLLCLAMSLSESRSPLAVWRERFRWALPHYLAFGPLALLTIGAYDVFGVLAILAVTLPAAAALGGHRRMVLAR